MLQLQETCNKTCSCDDKLFAQIICCAEGYYDV